MPSSLALGPLELLALSFSFSAQTRLRLFPDACQLGERKEALQLLGKAIDLAGKNDIRLMALEDRDLKPLWKDIAEI